MRHALFARYKKIAFLDNIVTGIEKSIVRIQDEDNYGSSTPLQTETEYDLEKKKKHFLNLVKSKEILYYALMQLGQSVTV